MTRNDPNTSYMSSAMRDRLQSDEYNLAVYRKPETITKEEILEEFLSFVQENFEMSQEEMSDLQALVNEFVSYDIKKVEKAEKALLAKWKEAQQ